MIENIILLLLLIVMWLVYSSLFVDDRTANRIGYIVCIIIVGGMVLGTSIAALWVMFT